MTTNNDTITSIYPSENTTTNHNSNKHDHDHDMDMNMDDLNHHYYYDNWSTLYHYRCVHCLYPSPELYRRLGNTGSGSSNNNSNSSSDIQLLSCDYCRRHCHHTSSSVYNNIHTTTTTTNITNVNNNRLIDPYCERELLLILMDVFVLFRISAYRHLLYNRYLLFYHNHNHNNNNNINDESSSSLTTTSRQPHPQQQRLYHIGFIFLMSVFIRSHICIIASNHHHESISIRNDSYNNNNNNNNTNNNYYMIQQWIIYIILSTMGYMIQIISTIILLLLCGCILFHVVVLRIPNRKRNTTATTTTTTTTLPTNDYNNNIIVTSVLPYNISYLCSISILYPSICIYSCTSILHVWENSNTIRSIGSMIILFHQWIFVQQIIYIITMTPFYFHYHHHRISQPIIITTTTTTTTTTTVTQKVVPDSPSYESWTNSSNNTIFWMIFQWMSLVLIWIAILDLKSHILQWCYTQFTSLVSSSSSAVFISEPDTTIMMTCPGLDGRSLILFVVERILGWSNHSVTNHQIESICFA